MKKAYVVMRSAILWTLSILHFFLLGPLLILLAAVIDPRKTDWLQRTFARNVVRFAGAGLRVEFAPGFDRTRTCIFVCNHVNIFDPFVLYSAIPQFIRGWELEDHFRIPVYGWMMKRFGNVPVSARRTPADLKRLLRLTKQSLDNGVSLVVFPEGGRTRDGRVRPFQDGIFRMLRQLQYPIVPVSIVGSFEFYHKGSKLFFPSTIVVHVHDTIETDESAFDREQVTALRDRVQEIVSRPVDEALGCQPVCIS